MIPYSNEQSEYFEFKIKYLDKLKDFNQDFNKLSENNKVRIMLEIKNYLPAALCNFESELKRRKLSK